jgi:hypothetical protein
MLGVYGAKEKGLVANSHGAAELPRAYSGSLWWQSAAGRQLKRDEAIFDRNGESWREGRFCPDAKTITEKVVG